MTIGEIIKKTRLKHRLTQNDVAQVLKTTTMFISAIENGKSKLPPNKLLDLCEYLFLDEDKIIRQMVKEYSKALKEEIYHV